MKKILVIEQGNNGVSFYRFQAPHRKLKELFGDEFEVTFDANPKLDDEALKQWDMVIYPYKLLNPFLVEQFLSRLDSLGVASALDIDDYWLLNKEHPLLTSYLKQNISTNVKSNLVAARNIITTTEAFAKEIRKINPNVYVIPNALDGNENQFKVKPTSNDRIRIGWLGSSTHLNDLSMLKGLVANFKRDGLLDKVQFVLCGFDIRGTKSVYDFKSKSFKSIPIKPSESTWVEFEKIFTDHYNIISSDYKRYLLKYEQTPYNDLNEPYRRIWTKDINTYAESYNDLDICLAPLANNQFNKMKSELKVIEAGWFGKTVIASNLEPYNAVLPKEYLVDYKNNKDWYKKLKALVIGELEMNGNRLQKLVQSQYDLNTVTNKRREIYNKIIDGTKIG